MLWPLLLERLTQRDLRFAAARAGERLERLRAEPQRLEALLERPELFDALFGEPREEPLVRVSPFLAFWVLLARSRRDLDAVAFVEEWVAPRRRLPVFDAEALRDLAADPLRRALLADVLSSYTHVVSGVVWQRGRRGWRPWRWSELDPLRMAQLLDVVPARDRPAVLRRLGDLALFLTGVFPDHVAERMLQPARIERLASALTAEGLLEETRPDAIGLLERLGRRAYEAVAAVARDAPMSRALAEVAGRFPQARRLLNFLTDRYLFQRRALWFGGA